MMKGILILDEYEEPLCQCLDGHTTVCTTFTASNYQANSLVHSTLITVGMVTYLALSALI